MITYSFYQKKKKPYLVENLKIWVMLKYKYVPNFFPPNLQKLSPFPTSVLPDLLPFFLSIHKLYLISIFKLPLLLILYPFVDWNALVSFVENFYIYLPIWCKHRCIPYKLEQNVEACYSNSENKLLVLMISSPNRDDLVFPKVSILLLYLFST